MSIRRPVLIAASAVLSLAGCSKDESSAEAGDSASPQAAAVDTAAMNAAVAPQAGTGNTAPVTVADIDRWQKGMEAELLAVQAAGAKLKAARNAQDTLNAMMETNEMSTLSAGAAAAGLGAERYKFVRSTLSAAALSLSPLELDMAKDMPPSFAEDMKKQGAANLARMSADIPSDVVEALRPRATDLRKQHMTLITERLRASGAA